jgi:hypothetical protein
MYMAIFQIFGFVFLFIPFTGIPGVAMVVGFGLVLPASLFLAAIIDTPLLMKKVGLEKRLPFSSGIRINCVGGTPLTILGPYALINDVRREELDWDKEVFIPLEPNSQYKILVQFRYFGVDIARSRAFFFVQLRPNEIQSYEYKIRSFFTQPYALITRKS